MKLIFLLTLLFSPLCFSQENNENEEKLIPVENVVQDSKSILGVNINLSQGNFEFAPSTKIPVEFNSVDVTYSKIRKSNITNSFTIEHAFNKSRTSFTSVYVGLGYSLKISDELQIIPMISAGVSLYKESSPTQNINSLGTNISIKSSIIYNIKDNFGIVLNLQYSRMMFSNSYTPKDPSGEMVYTYINSGIGLFWEL